MRRVEERERERMKLFWEKEREEMRREWWREREREERDRGDFEGGDGGREAAQRERRDEYDGRGRASERRTKRNCSQKRKCKCDKKERRGGDIDKKQKCAI